MLDLATVQHKAWRYRTKEQALNDHERGKRSGGVHDIEGDRESPLGLGPGGRRFLMVVSRVV